VEGARTREKKTWREFVKKKTVRKDCQACKLNREDAMEEADKG